MDSASMKNFRVLFIFNLFIVLGFLLGAWICFCL